MKLDRLSRGNKTMPLKTAFILDRMQWYEGTDVTLPAITIANSFMYDFTTEISKLESYATNSIGSLLTTAQILADIFKTTGITYSQISNSSSREYKLTSDLIMQRANDLKIAPEAADEVIYDLIRGFGRTIAGTGLAAGVVKSILESNSVKRQIEDFRKGSDPNPATWDQIVTVIGLAQQLYGKYCMLEDPVNIQKFIEDSVESNPLIRRIALLDSLLNRTVGPAMPTKLKNAMKGLLPFFDTKFLYSTKWGLNVYTEEITDVWWPIESQVSNADSLTLQYDDIGYCDLMATYFKCVRVIMGMDPSFQQSINVYTLLKETIKAGSEWPIVLPTELLPKHEKEVGILFERVFTEKLIYSILRANYGAFASRVINLRDSLKYAKNEQFDTYQRRNIQYLSLVFECFIQAAADMRNYANSDSVVYFDLQPEYLRQARAYVSMVLERQKPLNLSYEHPRSINDPNVLLMATGSEIAPAEPNYVWDDEGQSHLRKWIDVETLQAKTWVRTPVLQGVLHDAPLENMPLHILTTDYSDTRIPVYCLYVPLPEFVNSYPAFAMSLKFWSFDSLIDSGFYKYFSNQVDLLMPTSAEEMAREMDIPLQLAEKLYNVNPTSGSGGKRAIFQYQGPDKTLMWWKPTLMPIFEDGEIPQSIYQQQFRALWPFFSTGQSGDKTYKLVKGANGQPGFKTVQYQTLQSKTHDKNRSPEGTTSEPKPASSERPSEQAKVLNAASEDGEAVVRGGEAPEETTQAPSASPAGKGKGSKKRK